VAGVLIVVPGRSDTVARMSGVLGWHGATVCDFRDSLLTRLVMSMVHGRRSLSALKVDSQETTCS
jgi:hypothetical protein